MDKIRSEVTADVEAMWDGSNDDLWANYLKYVLKDTDIDEDSTTGKKYRIDDLYGEGVTILVKNEDTGAWDPLTEEDGLDEDVAMEQLIEAMTLALASSTENII
jgi:hypothetical protein